MKRVQAVYYDQNDFRRPRHIGWVGKVYMIPDELCKKDRPWTSVENYVYSVYGEHPYSRDNKPDGAKGWDWRIAPRHRP